MVGAVPHFADDMRTVSDSYESCRAIGHQVSCQFSYLDLQVATRKTRPPSQTPGAWSGIIAFISESSIGVYVAQDKWDKAKRYLSEIVAELSTRELLDRKSLESKRGFFVPSHKTFLKGFRLT